MLSLSSSSWVCLQPAEECNKLKLLLSTEEHAHVEADPITRSPRTADSPTAALADAA